MIEVRKEYQGNVILFGVSTAESGNCNVRMTELNGVRVNSSKMHRGKSMMNVVNFLEGLEVTEELCIKYKVHRRIEPNPPRKGEGYERLKAHVLHLNKYNVITKTFRRIGISSHFEGELAAHMVEGNDYQIERGAVKWVNIPLDEMEAAERNGLARADITEPLTMKKGGGKSRKIVKASMKMK